jgi:hypothetical protein
MLQNRLWTADRLLLRQWPNEYFCPLGVRNLETIRHLHMECPFTQPAWEQISEWTFRYLVYTHAIGRKTTRYLHGMVTLLGHCRQGVQRVLNT